MKHVKIGKLSWVAQHRDERHGKNPLEEELHLFCSSHHWHILEIPSDWEGRA